MHGTPCNAQQRTFLLTISSLMRQHGATCIASSHSLRGHSDLLRTTTMQRQSHVRRPPRRRHRRTARMTSSTCLTMPS